MSSPHRRVADGIVSTDLVEMGIWLENKGYLPAVPPSLPSYLAILPVYHFPGLALMVSLAGLASSARGGQTQ